MKEGISKFDGEEMTGDVRVYVHSNREERKKCNVETGSLTASTRHDSPET